MARARHAPTPHTRRQAEALAGYGVPHPMIARILAIGESTLRRYYHNELKDGEAKATAKVAQTLFQRATEGRELAACIFWLKARAGWRERHVLEHEPGQRTLEQLLVEADHSNRSDRRPAITVETGVPVPPPAGSP